MKSFGFPRHWVAPSNDTGKWISSRCHAAGGVPDRQYRLFSPSKVTLCDAIHTPGFKFENHIEAPETATLFHFDWIVRSHAQRRQKMEGYDRQVLGGGAPLAGYYLPESKGIEWYDWTPVNDPLIIKAATHLGFDPEFWRRPRQGGSSTLWRKLTGAWRTRARQDDGLVGRR